MDRLSHKSPEDDLYGTAAGPAGRDQKWYAARTSARFTPPFGCLMPPFE